MTSIPYMQKNKNTGNKFNFKLLKKMKMKTNPFLVIALFALYFPVFGTNPNGDKNAISKNLYDTLIIKGISNELYICTCKPNTCNPSGEGKLYFQGKWKQDLVNNEVEYRNCDERFLIQWDLSELPMGIEIIEAKMELYCDGFSGDKKGQLVYESITEPWNADIGYSKKPNTIIEDRVLTDWPIAKQYHIIDITSFIKKWYYDKIPNYGLMGYSINTETTNSAVFCSSKYPDKALQPKLIVVFKKNKA
jgi:hypothetical protein